MQKKFTGRQKIMAATGDVVLIYFRETPTFFARIESIKPDIKKDWFGVELLILAFPLKTVTWILRQEYLNGAPFTMDGNPVKIEPVRRLKPDPDTESPAEGTTEKKPGKAGGKVIPFAKPKKEDKKNS
jgi:hypothetical protein